MTYAGLAAAESSRRLASATTTSPAKRCENCGMGPDFHRAWHAQCRECGWQASHGNEESLLRLAGAHRCGGAR